VRQRHADAQERPRGRSLREGVTKRARYFVDPDGNSVELQADNFGDWKRSTDWMRTAPEFAANPIGVPVDPDRLVKAWREGASAQELHRRAYAGEFAPDGAFDLRLPEPG
jgi:catechol-2,3-dioxygenase